MVYIRFIEIFKLNFFFAYNIPILFMKGFIWEKSHYDFFDTLSNQTKREKKRKQRKKNTKLMYILLWRNFTLLIRFTSPLLLQFMLTLRKIESSKKHCTWKLKNVLIFLLLKLPTFTFILKYFLLKLSVCVCVLFLPLESNKVSRQEVVLVSHRISFVQVLSIHSTFFFVVTYGN